MNRTILALATILLTSAASAHFPIAQRLRDIDTNHDRALSLTEALVARQARFAALDTDQNQTLTVNEISSKVSLRTTNAPADVKQNALNRASERFSRLDKNNDGRITRAEWDAKVAELFARFDANNDRLITRPEVRNVRQSKRAQR